MDRRHGHGLSVDRPSAAGNSLEVDGNITGSYLYNHDAGGLVLHGSANVFQYYVYNYNLLDVDGTLSTQYYYVYDLNGGTLQGTGTVNASTLYGYYPVYIYGTLSPGTASGPGILHTGKIQFGSGGNFNVRLNGAATAGTDYDQLDVTGSVTLGSAHLNVSLGYTPAPGDSFLIVNNDGSDPVSGTFNGLAEGGLLVVGADVFQISYTGGDGNDVVLTRVEADIWTGASIAGSNWSDGDNWLGGVAPTAGDNLYFPAGPTQATTVNDFAAGTAFGFDPDLGQQLQPDGQPSASRRQHHVAGNRQQPGPGPATRRRRGHRQRRQQHLHRLRRHRPQRP